MKKVSMLLIGIIVVLFTQLVLAEDLGNEIITCGNFNCSDNWTIGDGFRIINASSLAVFSSIYYPNYSSLHQEVSLNPNEKYKVVLDVKRTWFDWHDFWIELGGVQSNVFDSEGVKTFYLEPTSDQNLTIWVNRTYNESINANVIFNNISVKEVSEVLNISFTTGTESSGSVSSTDNIYVNVSIQGSDFQNITYSLYNETAEINLTIFTSKIETINWTDLNDETYFYNVTISNSTTSFSTETRNISIEATLDVSFCRYLWKDNSVYIQTQDIEANGDINCIYIYGTNITFEGNGFEIINGGIFMTSLYDSTINNTKSNKITVETVSNNLIKNNYIHNCTNECLKLGDNYADTLYNTFENNILNSSNDTGINFRGVSLFGFTQGASHNIFRDISFYDIDGYDIYMPTISGLFTSQENKNNTFVNCSFEDEYVSGANNQLIRKWYYSVYLNDTIGNNISNANISLYNSVSGYEISLLTNEDGTTNKTEVYDYYNNAGSITNYSYTIIIDKPCYPSYRLYQNISNQTINYIELGSSTYQNWNESMANNCIINYPINMETYNLSFSSSGSFFCNSTINLNRRERPNINQVFYFSEGCIVK